MTRKIFVSSYGVIGKRLAYMVMHAPEFELVGVGKYTPDERTADAMKSGIKVFVPAEKLEAFRGEGFDVAGTIQEGIASSDLIVDASPDEKTAFSNKRTYEGVDKPAIFQGGAKRLGEFSVSNLIHNSRCNYEHARGIRYAIQGSCNVTGMGRIIQPLLDRYGYGNGTGISRVDIVLIRRAADIEEQKEVRDNPEWDRKPHHFEDAKALFPSLPIHGKVIKVPTRQMHYHLAMIRFNGEAPKIDDILLIYEREFGVAVLRNTKGKLKGPADIREASIRHRFPFGDTGMVHIEADVVDRVNDTAYMAYSDDQTGIVIPENRILLEAMLFGSDRQTAVENADKLCSVSDHKRIIEEEFA